MKKKILIITGVALVVFAGVFFWLNSRNRTLSPSGTANGKIGDLEINMSYSRPSARGRLIFGTEEEGALLVYGKYWRLGANEPTSVAFSRDVSFNGNRVPAGKYRIYAFPGKDAFDIVLNTEIGMWGAAEPDYSKDLLKTSIPVVRLDKPVEQLTFYVKPSGSGLNIVIYWADVGLSIPVQ